MSDAAVAYAAVMHYEDDEDLWGGIADRAAAHVQVGARACACRCAG